MTRAVVTGAGASGAGAVTGRGAPVGAGPRTAVGAGPLLSTFTGAGLLSVADVHVADRVGRLCDETDDRVLLAVALCVRAVRSGAVCVRLDDLATLTVPEEEDATPVLDLPWPDPERWGAAVRSSPAVAVGAEDDAVRPVRWVDGRVYLDRYWRDEQLVRSLVDGRLAAPPTEIDPQALRAACRRLFPDDRDARQRVAAASAALSRLTVLTGGPGTGKTTTVARLLAVLQQLQQVVGAPQASAPTLRVALAAPTGKAAARLQEAVRQVVGGLDAVDQQRVGRPEATTVHRLLGWRAGSSTRFRHDADHHLPHDVVVVDETSMVSLPLMARLLDALRPDARLVLVGDPDQLSSVQAGAVLGDLVARRATHGALPGALARVLVEDVPGDAPAQQALAGGVVRLEVQHRHGHHIGALARAVRAGRADDALSLLRAGSRGVSFVETAGDSPSDSELADVRSRAASAGVDLVAAARAGAVPAALAALESHRVLVAHRRGPAGVGHWAALVESWVEHAWLERSRAGHAGGTAPAADGPWYPGRPLLVTRNDRDTGLFNGDTGVVVAGAGTAPGTVVAAFGDPARPLLVRPHRLPAVETVHAMTVHRSQGSQFGAVTLVLPPATSALLTRELLYTAITRARDDVTVIGTEAALRVAIARPVRRASGLRED